jgi:hypothetical protein
MRRGSVRRSGVVGVGADAAWAVLGRPELLHLWFPGIVDCVVDGDQRTVTLGSGATLQERVLTNDPLQRRFQYRVDGPILREHLATVDVFDLGPDRCLVSYATDAQPAAMALVLGGAASGALDELRRQLEAGDGPAVRAAIADPPAPTAAEPRPQER